MRLSIQRAVAVETARGWRIAKEKASHKIDVVVALGMAALGA
jgi:phage terminase large subunit-like protein